MAGTGQARRSNVLDIEGGGEAEAVARAVREHVRLQLALGRLEVGRAANGRTKRSAHARNCKRSTQSIHNEKDKRAECLRAGAGAITKTTKLKRKVHKKGDLLVRKVAVTGEEGGVSLGRRGVRVKGCVVLGAVCGAPQPASQPASNKQQPGKEWRK